MFCCATPTLKAQMQKTQSHIPQKIALELFYYIDNFEII